MLIDLGRIWLVPRVNIVFLSVLTHLAILDLIRILYRLAPSILLE